MAAKPLPDQATLLKLLRYEPNTGKLFWRERQRDIFSDGGVGRNATWRTWNQRYAGKEAFPCPTPKGARGYRQAQIFKQKYLVHRVIWKMVTGEEPPQIDHINGDTTDNRFCNLRGVDEAENRKNSSMMSNNTSGCTGVFWSSQHSCWQARITVARKDYHLGIFSSLDDAISARKAGERRMGFHPNHGRKLTKKRAAPYQEKTPR